MSASTIKNPRWCIIERGTRSPLYLPMDNPEQRNKAHKEAQRILGYDGGDELEVYEGDPNGEGEEEPVLVGWWSVFGGWRADP
jgi:hypothetical protein